MERREEGEEMVEGGDSGGRRGGRRKAGPVWRL